MIESAINTTSSTEHIQSSSSPSASNIRITFNLDKNIDVAFNEVQAEISSIVKRLPGDAAAPIIQKVEADAWTILWLVLTVDRTVQQRNLYAANVIKKKLETINGVDEVLFGGQRDRVIRTIVSTERMAAYKLGANDLINAFNREHFSYLAIFLSVKTPNNLSS